MSDKSPADDETMILPKSPTAQDKDKPTEEKKEKPKAERKTRLIQHNRRMSITGATSKTTKDAEEMKQQIVTFLFEMADPPAVMAVYKAAKGEKRRIMDERDKAFEKAEKERKKQEVQTKKEEARKEKEAAKQKKKEEAQKKKEEAQQKKEEARKAKETEKEQKAREKEEAAKAKEEAAKSKKKEGDSPSKLKRDGSILGVSGRFKFGRNKKDTNVVYATGYLLAKHTELVETENPLHGQEDGMVVEAADGSKIDPRAKTIQTVAVKWKRNFFVLDSDGLSEYKEEVKDLEDRKEEVLAEHEFDGEAKLESESGDREFTVYAVGNKELGLRVMDPNDFTIWSKAFEKHFKMAKKRAKALKSPRKGKDKDKASESIPEEEAEAGKKEEEQKKEGAQEATAAEPEPKKEEAAAEAEAAKEPEKEKEEASSTEASSEAAST